MEYPEHIKNEYKNARVNIFTAIELVDFKIKYGLGTEDVIMLPMDGVAVKMLLEDCKKRYNYEQHKVVCKNCGKEFTAYMRTDTYYCDGPAPQDTTKTCKQYGALKTWKDKIKDESVWNCWYRRVYQSLQVKAKRNPDKPQLRKNYDNFRMLAKEWKKAVKDGTKTEEEFINWLQECRKMEVIE